MIPALPYSQPRSVTDAAIDSSEHRDGNAMARALPAVPMLTLHASMTSQDAQPLLFSASRVRPGRSSSSSLSHGRPPEWRREAPVAAKHAEARRDQQAEHHASEQHTLAPHLSRCQVGILCPKFLLAPHLPDWISSSGGAACLAPTLCLHAGTASPFVHTTPRAAKAPRNEEAPRQPTPASDRTSRRDRATRLLGNNAASACIPRPPIVCDAEVQGV